MLRPAKKMDSQAGENIKNRPPLSVLTISFTHKIWRGGRPGRGLWCRTPALPVIANWPICGGNHGAWVHNVSMTAAIFR